MKFMCIFMNFIKWSIQGPVYVLVNAIYEYLTNSLVAVTTSLIDGRTSSPHKGFFFIF